MRIESKNSYFQACFIRIKDENLITTYNQLAKEIFEISEQNEYMPHMSLFYGNITKSEFSEMLSMINLPKEEIKFEVNKLHIYRTPGAVDTWEKVGEVLV